MAQCDESPTALSISECFGTATLVNVNDVRGHAAVLSLLDQALAAI